MTSYIIFMQAFIAGGVNHYFSPPVYPFSNFRGTAPNFYDSRYSRNESSTGGSG